MHVRIMCRCTTWNVGITHLSLIEARVTHVRANNEHSTPPEASLAHAKIYFLVNLWRGIAKALNVKCSKLNDSEKGMHEGFIQKQCQPERANKLGQVSNQLISGSRGMIGPNEVRSLSYKFI